MFAIRKHYQSVVSRKVVDRSHKRVNSASNYSVIERLYYYVHKSMRARELHLCMLDRNLPMKRIPLVFQSFLVERT